MMSLRSRTLSTSEPPPMDTSELELQCVRCNGKVALLKRLPCLHPISICDQEECIESFERDGVLCTNCRGKFDYPADGFPAHTFALRKTFQERHTESGLRCHEGHDTPQTAVVCCNQCSANLCQECWNNHKKSLVLSKHTVVPLVDALRTGAGLQYRETCAKHGEISEVFCCNCQVMICYWCRTDARHSKHSFVSPDDAELLKSTKTALSTCILSSKNATKKLKTVFEEVESRTTDLTHQSKAAKAAVCKMIDDLIHTLQRRKDALLAEVNQIEEEGKKELENYRNDEIQPRITTLETYQQVVENVVDSGISYEQITLRKAIVDRIQDLSTATLPPTFPAPPSVLFEPSENLMTLSSELLSTGLVSRGVHPPSCTLEGLVVTDNVAFFRPWAAKPLSFDVVINDDSGKCCSLANEVVRAVLTPTTCGVKCVGSVARKALGCHSVAFTQLPSSQCQLVVTVNGENIKGSPLQVNLMHVRDLGKHKKEFDSAAEQVTAPSFRALCVSGDGQLLCTDNLNKEVCNFSQRGELLKRIQLESGSGFKGIAELSQGNLAVTCYDENVVRVYRPGGKLIRKIGQSKLKGPRGIVAVNNQLFVADRCQDRICVFLEDGLFQRAFGGRGTDPENLKHPDQMALGPGDEIYVADTGSKCVKVYQTNGTYTRCVITDVSGVSGLAVMSNRCVVVTQFFDNRVVVFDPKGCEVHSFTVEGTEHPYGLVFGQEGHLFVANLGTSTISQF